MIKILGAAAVVMCGGILGTRKSNALRERLRQLKQLQKAFCDISIALQYGSATTSEIISMLSRGGKLAFFSELDPLDLPNSLKNSESFEALSINAEERAIVCDVFSQLGCTDLATQLSMIEFAKARLSSAIAACEEECGKKCRLYDTLGFLGGIFVSLLII